MSVINKITRAKQSEQVISHREEDSLYSKLKRAKTECPLGHEFCSLEFRVERNFFSLEWITSELCFARVILFITRIMGVGNTFLTSKGVLM